MNSLIILSLQIHKHETPMYLFMSDSFQQYFVVFNIEVFHIFKFIPNYFIPFNIIIYKILCPVAKTPHSECRELGFSP